jgi:hypothetical protein
MQAKLIVYDSAERTFSAGPLACIPLVLQELGVHGGAEGPAMRGLWPVSPIIKQ